MTIGQALAAELAHELLSTRKLIALVPEAKAGWKPHPKSMTAGDLALHIAGMAGWVPMTLGGSEMDFAPPGGPAWTPPKFASVSATLAELDRGGAESVAALNATADPVFMEPWTLKKGGVALFTMPKVQVVRAFTISHLIHHRGQLDVYLRLLDIPLPQVYGPSADAPM